jgi:hypothetical protein
MKLVKILAIFLTVLMMAIPLVSCNKGGNGNDTSNETSAETVADVTLTVSIKVKDLSGKAVYDIASYTYSGKAPTIIDLIDDYFYMESEKETVEIDDAGGIRTIISIGSVNAGEVTGTKAGSDETSVLYTTFWWYTLNGKDGSKDLDEYIVQNGDKIEFYLKKVNTDTTTKK